MFNVSRKLDTAVRFLVRLFCLIMVLFFCACLFHDFLLEDRLGAEFFVVRSIYWSGDILVFSDFEEHSNQPDFRNLSAQIANELVPPNKDEPAYHIFKKPLLLYFPQNKEKIRIFDQSAWHEYRTTKGTKESFLNSPENIDARFDGKLFLFSY